MKIIKNMGEGSFVSIRKLYLLVLLAGGWNERYLARSLIWAAASFPSLVFNASITSSRLKPCFVKLLITDSG